MVEDSPEAAWERYRELLPKTRERYHPRLPTTIPYQGQVRGSFDYVPPEILLCDLRTWLEERREEQVFYFLTEFVKGERTCFEVGVPELTQTTLWTLNKGAENVIVSQDFSWALFMDHEGNLHVAGPRDLFDLLKRHGN